MKTIVEKYTILLVLSLGVYSCADLDYTVDSGIEISKPASVIVDEKVSSYDVLKSYSGSLLLGANASLANLTGTPMASLLWANFEQVTPSSELYQNEILSDDGSYDFSAINTYVQAAAGKGLAVYGDAIVSNFNMNSGYLSSLIAPFTFYTPLFPNMVKATPLYDASFDGWDVVGDISVEDYLGQPSVKMVNGSVEAGSGATSLLSPVYKVADGAKFEITFYLLSNKVGQGRVVFTGLNNNQPEIDWMENGQVGPTFTTKIGWNQIKFQTEDFDESGEFSFKIELGYTPEVNYYLNIQGLSLVNLNGSVDNPDEIFLECENAQEIGDWMTLKQDNEANVSGGKYLAGVINGNYASDDTYAGSPDESRNKPFSFTYTVDVKTTGVYRIWLRQRARVGDGGDDSFFMSVDGATYYCPGWPGWGDDTNTSNWTWFKLFTNSSNKEGSSMFYLTEGEHKLSIKIREGDHHFDKIYLTMTANVPTGLGSSAIAQDEVLLDISDDEKKAVVGKALNDYVETVLNALGDKINAWAVVKNPLTLDGDIAAGVGESVDGSFFWADYLGDDYVAEAFATAKENVSAETRLFISETGLFANTAKQNALVSKVSNVPAIDGIAFSLHLNLDSDLEALATLFEKLGESGKLIYISDLKVAVQEVSDESFASQSELYKTVVDLYKTKIPAAQQFGISLSDPVSDVVGLWSSGYNRKQAYAGFAVGLGAQE